MKQITLSFFIILMMCSSVISYNTIKDETDAGEPWILVIASSTLEENPGNPDEFIPTNVLDGVDATCWAEGGKESDYAYGSGYEEFIGFAWSEPINIESIKILPGFAIEKDIWRAYNRPKSITIYTMNNEYTFTLEDEMSEQQYKFPDEGLKGIRHLKIVMNEVYPGDKYDDTCISEIEFIYDNFNSDGVRIIYPDPKPSSPPVNASELKGANFFNYKGGSQIQDLSWNLFEEPPIGSTLTYVEYVGEPDTDSGKSEIEEVAKGYTDLDKLVLPENVTTIAVLEVGMKQIPQIIYIDKADTLYINEYNEFYIAIPSDLTSGNKFYCSSAGVAEIIGWEEMDHPIGDNLKVLHIRKHIMHTIYDEWWAPGYGKVMMTNNADEDRPFIYSITIPD